MTAPAVIFDVDGTLVDTTYLHTFAWFRALDDAGERRTMAAIHPLVGMGSTELLTTLLGRDDEAISEAHGEHFAELHRYVRPLPGARPLVRHVKAEGGRVVIPNSTKLGLGCVAVGTGGIDLRRLEGAGALRAYESCAAVLEGWAASPLARLLGPAAAG
ncbi:MAG: HAD family hydrolase [Acidimicrobiales bacterium]